MRFLHTADWHIGKKLGRISRSTEFEAVLDEVVGIARDEQVDAVLVSGDLWDRALPPLESIELVIDALIRLAEAAGTVVAISGNHDSAALFQLLGRLLEPRGVYLRARIAPPERGGTLNVRSRDGSETACVAVFPFLNEALSINDVVKKSDQWFESLDSGALLGTQLYADRIRRLASALCAGFEPGGIGILMGHWFVEGAELGGGERKVHMGTQYAATAQSVPPGAAYVALGHIHRPQEIPGSAVPARYCGSLLQLDFSERTHQKQVWIVDVPAGSAARVRSIPLSAGRKLIRIKGGLDELQARAGGLGDAYLDVRVKTSGPVFGLMEQVRKFLPHAVMVQAEYDRLPAPASPGSRPADSSIADLYSGYHCFQHGVPAPPELLEAVRALEQEAFDAAS